MELRGKKEKFEMFADPMDASVETMTAAEQGNFMTFTLGLFTANDRRRATLMGLTARELVDKVMPAYNEVTGQGED